MTLTVTNVICLCLMFVEIFQSKPNQCTGRQSVQTNHPTFPSLIQLKHTTTKEAQYFSFELGLWSIVPPFSHNLIKESQHVVRWMPQQYLAMAFSDTDSPVRKCHPVNLLCGTKQIRQTGNGFLSPCHALNYAIISCRPTWSKVSLHVHQYLGVGWIQFSFWRNQFSGLEIKQSI